MQKIKNFIINNKNYATVIIRVSLALVLLWFGIDEIVNSENWFGYIPLWLTSNMPFNIENLIILNGIFEIIIGVLLLIGLYTRIIAFIAALHLLSISIAVGYNDIAVRDLGLTLMAFSLIFSGAGVLSLDNKIRKYKK